MKHFINIFVVLVLIGLSIGVAYMTSHCDTDINIWGLSYIPIIIFMFLWGYKLYKDY